MSWSDAELASAARFLDAYPDALEFRVLSKACDGEGWVMRGTEDPAISRVYEAATYAELTILRARALGWKGVAVAAAPFVGDVASHPLDAEYYGGVKHHIEMLEQNLRETIAREQDLAEKLDDKVLVFGAAQVAEIIKRLMELEAQATKGPWVVFTDRSPKSAAVMPAGCPGDVAEHLTNEDAAFIAAARNALPDIFAHMTKLEALRAAIVEYEAARAAVDDRSIRDWSKEHSETEQRFIAAIEAKRLALAALTEGE